MQTAKCFWGQVIEVSFYLFLFISIEPENLSPESSFGFICLFNGCCALKPFLVVHLLTLIKVPTTKPCNKYLFFFFFLPISFGFMLLPHSLESSARQWYWNKELTLESLTFGSLEIMGFAAIIKKVDAKCSLFLVEASISCLTPAWALIMFHSLDPSFFASSSRLSWLQIYICMMRHRVLHPTVSWIKWKPSAVGNN